MKTIEVTSYNPNWPLQYEDEAKKIKEALSSNVIKVHHIGSTSISGLSAKKELDILLIVNKINDSLLLQNIGYRYKGEINIPLRYFFSKNTEKTSVNLHACEKNHGFISLNLAFRDWLRNNPDDRQDYQKLKYKILQSPNANHKVSGFLSNYTRQKDSFIKGIIKKSGHNTLTINFCLHDNECSAARKYRQKYFLKKKSIEDPFAQTFAHENHKHFILYQGAEIVGYAHAQLRQENRAAIHIISINKEKRRLSFGSQFIQMIEKWLNTHGYKTIHAKSPPEALNFYKKLGYNRVLLYDPDVFEAGADNSIVEKL